MIFEDASLSFSVYPVGKFTVGINLHASHNEPSKSAEEKPEWWDQILIDLRHGTLSFSQESFPRSAGVIKTLQNICSNATILPKSVKDHGFTGYAYQHGITFHIKYPEAVSSDKSTAMALANAGDHY